MRINSRELPRFALRIAGPSKLLSAPKSGDVGGCGTNFHRRRKLLRFQRTPWGGGKRRGVENLTNDTPPKKGFWTPLVRYVFHPPHVSVLCFSCTEIHDRADQKLFWRGPKIFGRARSLVRFPPPLRFAAPPHITAQRFLAPLKKTEKHCDL